MMKLVRRLLRVAAAAAAFSAAAAAACGAAESVVPRLPEQRPELEALAPPQAWDRALRVDLAWDVSHARPASERTTVGIQADSTYIYVRFDARQSQPLVANQATNNVGLDTNDEVWIDLWPDGSRGYFYKFVDTPLGTHYQMSSENTAYEPKWQSLTKRDDGGYVSILRIPRAALKNGANGRAWKIQVARLVNRTGETDVWSYGAEQRSADDLAFAATVTMPDGERLRPKPRLGAYALSSFGGATEPSTSRVGADFSLPVLNSVSLFGTLHPDYSNIEVDQQSISPTVYARPFYEVRPFFTQGASFFSNVVCQVCNGIRELYTPAIPTPSQGYAIEGVAGRVGFAGFDAIGSSRQDIASAVNFTSQDLRWKGTVERVSSLAPGFTDDVTVGSVSFSDQKHVSAYADYGMETGTDVHNPSDARRYELGGGWASTTFAAYAAVRSIGESYDPVDGYVAHPGTTGYAVFANKVWLTPVNGLQSIALGGKLDRYRDKLGNLNQSDGYLILDVLTKTTFDLVVSTGSDYFGIGDRLVPVSQNGISLVYHSGSQQNASYFAQHGASPTPTQISFNTGAYGLGRLNTWSGTSTVQLGLRGFLSLELDNTSQTFAVGAPNVQWLERLGYVRQLSRDASFAIGLRRVVGSPPVPNGGGLCTSKCSNVSMSYHHAGPRGELYLGYGDPNALSTTPQAIVKYIFYASAQKGT